jgi:hypothetical protein
MDLMLKSSTKIISELLLLVMLLLSFLPLSIKPTISSILKKKKMHKSSGKLSKAFSKSLTIKNEKNLNIFYLNETFFFFKKKNIYFNKKFYSRKQFNLYKIKNILNKFFFF